MTDMMVLRRAGLGGGAPLAPGGPFTDMRVTLPPGTPPHDRLAELAHEVAGRLVRTGDTVGPGAVLVSGLAAHFDLAGAREFHEQLFGAVWTVFRDRARLGGAEQDFRVKTGTITDGRIPRELYGSEWSFKDFHVDREVLLFSHLYGPVAGFTGGELLLVDIRPYMLARGLGFDDVFEWSAEPTEGSKPVLRAGHCETAFAECGVDVGAIGPDTVVFVNNLPDAGILHGVRPVVVTDPRAFHREYHRCGVKDVS